MKPGLLSLLAAVLLVSFTGARADTDITFQDFYDALSPYGDWVELDDYGYCWRPFVDDHWRPYTDGQWVYTDAGYTWFSNEPWGWATYHYGRWTKVQSWGWVWVPGYEWGPAWVSWRTNDDYIGWAALPPEAVWEPSTGFGGYVDVDYGIGPDWYAFCPVTYFGAPRLRTVCLPWRNNITIINLTVNITRIRNVNNLIINEGPDITVINRRAQTPIRRARLEREGTLDVTALRQGQLKNRLEGDTLKIPSPRVEKQDARPAKIAGRASRAQINRGWEGAGLNPALAEQYRHKMQEEARRAGQVSAAIPPQTTVQSPSTPPDTTRQEPRIPSSDSRSPAPTPTLREPDRQPQVLPRDQPPHRPQSDRQPQVPPRDQPPTGQPQNREGELRARILQQRQQQEQETRQTEVNRQQEQARQNQQALRQQQQQQEETNRQQRAAELREKAARAQQEAETRREAARRQQQQEAVRQQQEHQQRQQQSLQQQLQQQRQQMQQNRQERRQSP